MNRYVDGRVVRGQDFVKSSGSWSRFCEVFYIVIHPPLVFEITLSIGSNLPKFVKDQLVK